MAFQSCRIDDRVSFFWKNAHMRSKILTSQLQILYNAHMKHVQPQQIGQMIENGCFKTQI